MAFATRCPHCNTVFKASSEQLSLSSGMVRCGTCNAPFNGIEHLIGRIVPSKETPVEPAAVSGTSAPAEPTITESTPAEVIPTQQAAIVLEREPAKQPTNVVKPEARTVAPANTDEPSETTAESNTLPAGDSEQQLRDAFDAQLKSFSLEIDAPEEPNIGKTPEEQPLSDVTKTDKAEPILTDATPIAPPTETPKTRKKQGSLAGVLLWIFIFLVLAAAGCLVATYYYGKEISEEVPELEETVETVCEQLSCPAEPPPPAPVVPTSDLTLSYETVAKDTVLPNAYNQNLTIANTGRQKMPWPSLVLEITDAKGTLLYKRSLKPKDYLSHTLSKTDGIEPATKHDLKLHFEFKYPLPISSRLTIDTPTTPAK
jgi:predicted Zn finger-like uncharacterized protein